MKKILLLITLLTACTLTRAQTVKLLTSGTKASLRGLSVVSDQIVWASGSGGYVAKSLDGGETWKWTVVKGFEKKEFRDIEAFDAKTAVIIAIDSPAVILKTTDGGDTWKEVYRNNDKGMFLDAMEFWNEQSGIVIGDPIDGKFFIARTFDGGNSWQTLPKDKLPAADKGEACFASSGTNIRKLNKREAIFISGGLSSHLFMRDQKILLPVVQGKESTGTNSIAVKNKKTFMVAGGDFEASKDTLKNCFITRDGGITWTVPAVKPNGYRSCIEYAGKKQWVACGLTGVDFSGDDGNTFAAISKESFHVCRVAKKGKTVFLAGGNGKIAKIIF